MSCLRAYQVSVPLVSLGEFQGVGLSALGTWTAVGSGISESGCTVQISGSDSAFGPADRHGYAWGAVAAAP